MGFLCAFGFGGELTRLRAEVVGSIHRLNTFTGRYDRLLGQMYGISPHVGDVAIFVQTLGRAHRVPRRQTNFTVGFLLKCGRCEWGRRFAGDGAFFDIRDGPSFAVESCLQCPRFVFI